MSTQSDVSGTNLKGAGARSVCAIEIHEQKLLFAHINYERGDGQNGSEDVLFPVLKSYGTVPHDGIAQLQTPLAEIISKYDLRDAACIWVLNPSQYRLLLVDVPNVPSAEYKEALRWQLKDIVDYPLDDITLDIFAPAGAKIEETKKIYVVIAQTSFLRKVSDLLSENFLNLVAIDIREFALRNLVSALIKNGNSLIGCVCLSETLHFMIVMGGKIYFTRGIPLDHSKLNDAATAMQYLMMELHRSVDYFEAEFRQSIPPRFFVGSTVAMTPEVLKTVVSNFAGEAEIINLAKVIKIKDSLKDIIAQPEYSPVLGAALRQL